MIRRGTKIQLLVFLVLTVVGISYVALSYIGLNPLNSPYTVSVKLASSGGIFTNADVTERGVVIGRVGQLHIAPDGVVVDLSIDHGKKIPATGLHATVANLSAVGEQYVDLEPATNSPPYLKSGDQIPESQTTLPPDDAKILLNLDKLLNSVNVHDLSTVINELGKGFQNLGPSLQNLIDSTHNLTTSAIKALPPTLQLVDRGKTVLNTQRDVAGELKSFAKSFADLTGEVAQKDPALRQVFSNGVLASHQIQDLLQQLSPSLPPLLTNLNTFTGIEAVRIPYTRAVLELYPAIVADSFYALPAPAKGQPANANFGLITNLGPGCTTGFSSTKQRSNKPIDWGGAANLDAFCRGNNAKLDASGINIRGSRNDPRPPGDTAQVTNSDPNPGPGYPGGFPGSGKVGPCGTPTCPASSSSSAHARRSAATPSAATGTVRGYAGDSRSSADVLIPTPYDPQTGMVRGLDGKLYQLGVNGSVARVFGSSSYAWLLIAPTMR